MRRQDPTLTTKTNTYPYSAAPFIIAVICLVDVDIVGACSNAVSLPLDRAPEPAPIVPDLALEQKVCQVAGNMERNFLVVGGEFWVCILRHILVDKHTLLGDWCGAPSQCGVHLRPGAVT
jgi:hypothetical protein